jgi:hypothetical protein
MACRACKLFQVGICQAQVGPYPYAGSPARSSSPGCSTPIPISCLLYLPRMGDAEAIGKPRGVPRPAELISAEFAEDGPSASSGLKRGKRAPHRRPAATPAASSSALRSRGMVSESKNVIAAYDYCNSVVWRAVEVVSRRQTLAIRKNGLGEYRGSRGSATRTSGSAHRQSAGDGGPRIRTRSCRSLPISMTTMH